MTKRRRSANKRGKRADAIDWKLAGDGVPTIDVLQEIETDGLEDALEGVVWDLEQGISLRWEATIREEQHLPLSRAHEEALADLISFSDEPDDRVLYIDDIERPVRPWYETVLLLAQRLCLDAFETAGTVRDAAHTDGWDRLAGALEEHTDGLSLPEGATSAIDVVPAELRLRLELQSCWGPLAGIGQRRRGGRVTTLDDEGERWRLERLLESLCERSDALASLSVDAVLGRIRMPVHDRQIVSDYLIEQLGLDSSEQPMAEALTNRAASLE